MRDMCANLAAEGLAPAAQSVITSTAAAARSGFGGSPLEVMLPEQNRVRRARGTQGDGWDCPKQLFSKSGTKSQNKISFHNRYHPVWVLCYSDGSVISHSVPWGWTSLMIDKNKQTCVLKSSYSGQPYWKFSKKHVNNLIAKYRGSPTSTVSTSMNSTSTIFSAIGIKLVLVEFLELAM